MAGKKKRAKGPAQIARSHMDSQLISLMTLVEGKKYPEVELAARRILTGRQNHPLAVKALTFALIGQWRYEEALPILDHALASGFEDPELYNNRGIALSGMMRWDEAIADFLVSLRFTPDDPEILKNLGVAYFRMHRWDDSISCLLKAIEYHPGDYVDAVEVLANALAYVGRIDEAWVCFNELWNSQKEVRFLYELISTSLRRCEWTGIREKISQLRVLSDGFSVPLGNPFISLSCPGIDSTEQRLIAFNYTKESIPKHFLTGSAAFQTPVSRDGRRLRVGYLSADFGDHPVAYVMPRVIELHDRTVVEVFGYSVGVDDKSEIRQRLASAFDCFVDLHHAGVNQLVRQIRGDAVDILIDLQGWTAYGRPEALALRCAPIQINWLGYAGTIGHEHLADYLIGDSVVTPLERCDCYTECLANLPGAYLPADNSCVIPSPPSREHEGLPETGFVFASFNNSYKFNPDVFDLWCAVLRHAENSVLWLSRPAGIAAENLINEASLRGIEPARIVFASRTKSRIEHLARLQLADLALDPFPYNSHSTGIDALWAGVPMVTYLGGTFPGRVGASLLKNVGLEELVAYSADEYKEIVLSLYSDRERLALLRKRLESGRGDSALFDMPRFVRSLENLYISMWDDYESGKWRPRTLV